MDRSLLIFAGVAVIAAALVIGGGCSTEGEARSADLADPADPAKLADPARLADLPPTYVGRAACVECHLEASKAHHGSHHDHAMQEPTDATVLGDFSDVAFVHFGVESRFSKQGARFMVRTDGPDGELTDYRVAYVFGVYPLQQYLVRFPGGRLQTLGICWDARPAADGGQRWFHLYRDEKIPPGDALHWTGPNQNWNFMCAHCHSTNLRKNYDLATDTYSTTWSEIDVSCEACHGPASRHLAWARVGAPAAVTDKGLLFDLQSRATWRFDAGTPTARRVAGTGSDVQVQKCAPCHSRRTTMSEDQAGDRTLLDGHRLSLLDPGLYHADGQILDEVYVYGSFLQSKMFHAGVTCSDCHQPHSLRLLAEGNSLCVRCHEAATFDTEVHHHHAIGSRGAACVECHMPAKHYMVIDPRRDHSFRVPRPDLSTTLGTPNACNACHTDQSSAWAAQAIAQWRGAGYRPPRHFGLALHAGRTGANGASYQLATLARDPDAPALVRATALSMLQGHPGQSTLDAVHKAITDADALVRIGALHALDGMPTGLRGRSAETLLADPVRGVRIEAARILADLPPEQLAPASRAALDRAIEEYRGFQMLNADRAWAHVNLGLLELRRGRPEVAQRAYETALRLDPRWLQAYVNLADLHRGRGDETDCDAVLRAGLRQLPDGAELHHALGLSLSRRKDPEAALRSLQRAAQLRPEVARFSYAYALALDGVGRKSAALEVLRSAHARDPRDVEVLYALATMHRDAGQLDQAIHYATELNRLAPDDHSGQALLRELQDPPRRRGR